MLDEEQHHFETSGYITDVPYIFQYFEQLAPINLKMAAALNGIKTADIDKPFIYLELGCGNALSLLEHAAAYPHAQFYGIDLMSQHIEFAEKIKKDCGLKNVTLIEGSFKEIDLSKIPECDFIVAHGVISWISEEVHAQMRDIVKNKLKNDGLYYVSYNALPGWADRIPLRELIAQYTDKNKNSTERMQQAVKILDFLSAHKAAYFVNNPRASKHLEQMKKHNIAYLIHEYMHDSWQPYYFREINQFYFDIGMRYAGNSAFQKNFYDLFVPKDFHEVLKNTGSRVVMEGVVDFITNNQFRMDIYVKPPLPDMADPLDAFDGIYLTSLKDKDNFPEKFKIDGNQYTLNEPVYAFFREELSQKICSMHQLIAKAEKQFPDKNKVVSALKTFIALRQITPCVKPFPKKTQENKSLITLNELLINQYTEKNRSIPLASELLGSAVNINQATGIIIKSLWDTKQNEADAVTHFLELVEKQKSSTNIEKDKLEQAVHQSKTVIMPMFKRYGMLH